jgi:hypothetical protein
VNFGIPAQLVGISDLFLAVGADGCGVCILEGGLSGAGGVRRNWGAFLAVPRGRRFLRICLGQQLSGY